MANQTYSIKFDAEAGPLISGLSKVEKATAKVSKAQDALNKIAMSSAAAESPLAAIRLKASQDLARLNKLYESGSISMKQYNTAVNQVISRQKAQIASMKSVSGGIRSMRGAMGQLGYQVQDVAVQLQMGQNAFLVLAQQGSQIASIFGPGGAVFGAFLAIGGAIAMSLLPGLAETRKTIDELLSDFDKLSDQVKNNPFFKASAIRLAQKQSTDAYKAMGDSVRDLDNQLRKQRVTEEQLAYQREKGYVEGTKILEEAYRNQQEEIDKTNLKIADQTQKYKDAEEALKLLKGEIIKPTKKPYEEEMDAAVFYFKETQKEREKELDQALKKENQLRKEAEQKIQQDVNALRSVGLDNQRRELQNNFVEQLKLVEQYEKSVTDVKFDSEKARQQINENMQKAAVGEFSKGIDALGAYNKKAFKIAKGVKTAEAIMNTYAGANQALAAYPPPFSYIAAAGQIAYGMAQVAQIKSQTFAGRAAGGMVQAGQPYMVGEMGKEMFIPSTSGRIANNNEVQGGMGTTNVNFSITTVDARGFDELLTSRRSQIVNMVNQAMNDRGRAGVV